MADKPRSAPLEALDFATVLDGELEAVNARRQWLAGEYPESETELRAALAKPIERDKQIPAEVRNGIARTGLKAGHHLFSLALSGDGARSASMGLGVLQALDAIRKSPHHPSLVDRMDYMSATSGGNFIATAAAVGLAQGVPKAEERAGADFPFSNPGNRADSPGTRYLRGNAGYLKPYGDSRDILTLAASSVGGLIINLFLALPVVLLISAFTIVAHGSNIGNLGSPFFGMSPLMVILLLFAFVMCTSLTARLILPTSSKNTIWSREMLRLYTGVGLFLVLACILWEVNSIFLDWLDTVQKSTFVASTGGIKTWFTGGVAAASAASAFTGFAQKFAKAQQAANSGTGFIGWLKKGGAHSAMVILAVAGPLLVYLGYAALTLWGLCGVDKSCFPQPPVLMQEGAHLLFNSTALFYVVVALVVLLLGLPFNANTHSYHNFYRDRLAHGYLAKHNPDHLSLAKNPVFGSADVTHWCFSALKRRVTEGDEGRAAHKKAHHKKSPVKAEVQNTAVTTAGTAGWTDSSLWSPFLLVNAALTISNLRTLNEHGRHMDFFTISPLFFGCPTTGYAHIEHGEEITRPLPKSAPELTLAAAMALCGAPLNKTNLRFGKSALQFSMSLLNVKLGFWMPNPGKIHQKKATSHWLHSRGFLTLWRELLMQVDFNSTSIHLDDGSHLDNLGLYELLRRQSKLIIVMDAEVDPSMTFSGFVRVQEYARIDFGVTIDLDWRGIHDAALNVIDPDATSTPDPSKKGPHAAIGRIDYGGGVEGVLIYVKSSMTGDENDTLLDYRLKNPQFPHQATSDRSFTTEQFEVYRALGFHVTHRLFAGVDDFTIGDDLDKDTSFADTLNQALGSIGLRRIPNTRRLGFIGVTDPSEQQDMVDKSELEASVSPLADATPLQPTTLPGEPSAQML